MPEETSGSVVLRGIAVSPGIHIGPVHVHDPALSGFGPRYVAVASVDREIERLDESLALARDELTALREKIRSTIDESHAAIFDPHILFVQDPFLREETVRRIRDRRESAAFAVARVVADYAQRFRSIEDEYIASRVGDVEDVGNRIRKILARAAGPVGLREEAVVVSHDLSPSDTAQMDHARLKGIAIEAGGPTSHTAILARALQVPAVVGLGPFVRDLGPEARVVIDGYEGTLTIDPSESEIRRARNLRRRKLIQERDLKALRSLPAETIDGYQVRLAANLELPSEIPFVLESGACGIGLLRTEFLFFAHRGFPPEDVQAEVYAGILRGVPGHVVFRTLDVGGDKFVGPAREEEAEANPFLGLRGIRFCLARPDVFATQLRALLRASAEAPGRAKIMFPMVSSAREIAEARALLERCKRELEAEGRDFDPEIEVGVMIEIPAAAVVADRLARHVDFFSVGTNDLIQYALAVDRSNERVARLYDPFHPAVLRLVRRVVDASRREGIRTSVCGEMASNPMTALLLVGMGVDELSMGPLAVPGIKFLVRNARLVEARRMAQDALALHDSDEIRAYVTETFARFRKGRLAGGPA